MFETHHFCNFSTLKMCEFQHILPAFILFCTATLIASPKLRSEHNLIHNWNFQSPNGKCKFISISSFEDLFNGLNIDQLKQGFLYGLLSQKFGTPTKLQFPKWESTWNYWDSFLCIFSHLWECVWVPWCVSKAHLPFHALVLIVSQKLESWLLNKINIKHIVTNMFHISTSSPSIVWHTFFTLPK